MGILLITLVLLIVLCGFLAVAALPMLKRRVKRALAYHMEEHLRREGQNIGRARQQMALHATAVFVEEHLQGVRSFAHKNDVLDFALNQVDATRPGMFCEFGVYQGGTINHIATRTSATIHGFDSFEGLPEHWRDDHAEGTFKVDDLPAVARNVTLHQGWFDKTLPQFVTDHGEPVAFLHVDCDLYSSTKTIFEYLGDRFAAGTIIVFDEYFNYPGWEQGEHKAFLELVEEKKLTYEFIAYNRLSEQVAVRITAVGN